jgi:hypothetical protein
MKKKKPTLLSSREEEEEQRVVGVFATTKTTTRLFQFLNPIDSELHRLSTKIEAECFPLLREREIPIVAEDDDDDEEEDFDDGVVKKTDATTADGVVSLLFLNRPRSVFVFVSDLCVCVSACVTNFPSSSLLLKRRKICGTASSRTSVSRRTRTRKGTSTS